MDSKSIIAAVTGGIVFFILGYLFYAVLFAGFFESNVGSATGYMKEMGDVNLLAIFLGSLAVAILLTIIFGSWANIKTFAAGSKAGAIFGLLVSLSWDLTLYGTTNAYNLTAALVDPIIGAVMVGITGGVIGMMLGRGTPKEAVA